MGQHKILSRLQQPVAQTTAHRKSTSSSQPSAEQGLFHKLGNRRRQRLLKGTDEQEAAPTSTPKEMFEAANALYQGGEFQKALDAFNSFVSAHGNRNGTATYNIAQCYRMIGRRDLAIEMYRRCLEEGLAGGEYAEEVLKQIDDLESTQQPAFERAQKAYEVQDYKTAMKYYIKAMEGGMIRRASALFNIAQCNRKLKRYENALLFYQECLDAGIGEYEAEVIGRIDEMRAKLGIETDDTGEIVPLTADEYADLFFRGNAEMKLKHYDEALAIFTELHERHTKAKNPGVSYFNLAQCNRLLSRFSVALYLYEQAVQSNVGEYEREAQDRIFELRRMLNIK
jgi:tetratricopeptide (TPR) repeat protein